MIQLKKRPYDINFSGNPVVYTLYSEDAVYNIDLVFEARIMFKDFEETSDFKEICTIPLTPVEGLASIDIAEILRSCLEYDLPELSSDPTVSKRQTGEFYILYREYNINLATEEVWMTTEVEYPRLVVKGGLAPFLLKGNNYWVNYFPDNKPFLTWQPSGRLASLTERLFLSFLNTTDVNVGNIKAEVLATYTDGSTTKKTFVVPVLKNHIAHIPVGAQQTGIIDPAKLLWYWEVAVYDYSVPAAPVKISVFKFECDNRNDYQQVTLHYHNSVSGFDSVRVLGVIESTVNLDGSDAEGADPFYEDSLSRRDRSLPHREILSYKGDIGHLSRQEQDRLRDAFLLREVWMEKFGRWWPVKLLTKQYRLRTSRDNRFSLPIDWTIADGGSNYYTPDIDLGDGLTLNNVCSAVITDIEHTMVYGAGNTLATITYTFQVEDPEGENITLFQYRIPGLIENWTDMVYPYVNPLSTNHAVPNNFVIYFRAVCEDGSFGPVSTHAVNIPAVGGPAPVYNSNLYNSTQASTPYSITLNGSALHGGSLGPGEFSSFQCHDTEPATVVLELAFIIPTKATLETDGVISFGTIQGNKVTWNIGYIKGGMIIEIK